MLLLLLLAVLFLRVADAAAVGVALIDSGSSGCVGTLSQSAGQWCSAKQCLQYFPAGTTYPNLLVNILRLKLGQGALCTFLKLLKSTCT